MEPIESRSEMERLLRQLAEFSTLQYNLRVAFRGVQFWVLLAAVVLFAVGGVLAFFFHIGWLISTSMRWVTVSVLLLATICAAVAQFISILSSFKGSSQPVKKFLLARTPDICRDYHQVQLIKGSSQEIKFLAARLHLEAEHFRGRLGTFVGALDKVGIIPLLAGAVVALLKTANDLAIKIPITISWFEIAVAVLGILMVLSAGLVLTGQRIDELAQMLEFALIEIDQSRKD